MYEIQVYDHLIPRPPEAEQEEKEEDQLVLQQARGWLALAGEAGKAIPAEKEGAKGQKTVDTTLPANIDA